MSCPSGPAPELTLAQVLTVFLPEYRDRHLLPAHHLKVLRRLALCHSGQLGWTVWQCQQCRRTHWRPHGCGDRHCPACQHQRSRQWLQEQRRALLPVRYFHWVFTLPATLRPLALQNPAALYRLLFECASATLLQFGQQRFQAELGITAILHTWGQNLMHHPHLHCLVTGGGLTAQNTWAGPKQTRWLFPVHAVARMFQGKFCAGLLQLHAAGQLQFQGQCKPLQDAGAFAALLRQVRARRWVVFAKGSVVGPDAVLDYLGRYTHRVAITNGRLRTLDPSARTVSFTYKDYADGGRLKTLTLTGDEFLRRFRLHVLPPGFTKIRHYGLLGNNRRHQRVPRARAALETSPLRFAPKPTPRPATPALPPLACPHCQGTEVRCIGRVERSGKVNLFATRLLLARAAPPYADSS
ncbi:MAG: IS91 family transposase [Limisphaerales bacterium]